MEVHAITKNIPMSAQKMREVVRQIQGLPAAAGAGGAGGGAAQGRALRGQDAASRPSPTPEEQQQDSSRKRLRVKEAVAGTATSLKRFHPQGARFAGPILKRRCHIKITLSDE